jgi:simple sugar transport system ATP-binding protein
MEAIAGIRPSVSGDILMRGHPVHDPRTARSDGMGHVPEDRLRMALVGNFQATENAILGYQALPRYGRGVFLERASILETTRRWLEQYDVRPRAPRLEAVSFSGGNQQKLVLAREMEHDPELLLVGQPTRGVDIGAIEFIHRRLIEMRDAGKAVLLVSVELDEILGLADRILVICDGRITGELAGEQADERKVGLLMAGGSLEEAA